MHCAAILAEVICPKCFGARFAQLCLSWRRIVLCATRCFGLAASKAPFSPSEPMARFRRVLHGAASGYVLLIVTSVCSLASVPIALYYLSTLRFGIWIIVASIGGYLNLVDLGMSSSVARLLIDHKDNREGGTYGGLIQTGCLVLIAQGALVFVAGFSLAPAICNLLPTIPPDLQPEFIQLLRWQSLAWALSFALRIFSHLLVAHQRYDIFNYSQTASLVLNLVLLWFFFHAGQGVFSLMWAALLSSLVVPAISYLACWRLELFPPTGAWGHASWRDFKEIFGYGKDLFLVAVGTQLIMASQTLIITRQLGLGAVTVWGIGTKTFSLVSQVIWRFFDVSGPALGEMIFREEHARLCDRFRTIVVATLAFSAMAAVIYAMCNSLFVEVWTQIRRDTIIYWPPVNDLLLAAWMIILALVHCHNGFVLITKQIGFMRYVYFVEGVVFVGAAFLTAGWGGLPAVIICSVVCSAFLSGAYGVWRTSRYLELPLRDVAFQWLEPTMKVLLSFAPVALVCWWGLKGVNSPILRLALNAVLGGSIGSYLFLRFGLPRELKRELIERAPERFNPILRRVFVGVVS
jgi:O-antigen/teichoic acid export membrane protein